MTDLKARNVRRKPRPPSDPGEAIPPAALDARRPPAGLGTRASRVARAIAGVAMIVGIAGAVAWGARIVKDD